MITFCADIRSAIARSDDAITTESVGIPVQFFLGPEFTGLAKTVVFTNGTASVDIALVGDATGTELPVDVLRTTGYLKMGIYAADGEGNIVIPTVWAMVGRVLPGTIPSGVDPSAPTPSWVAQVQNIASEANENAETALNKATAVEEAAAAGDFDGTDGVSPTVSISGITGGHRVTITDADGSHVFDVMDGTDGYSPTVTVEEIIGGHRVTITDVDGDHTFDVMDGTGGGGGGAVDSVNGYTGDVWLSASDVGALPDTYTAPVSSVNSKTGAVSLDKSDIGLGNVDNVKQYSASNPPPYPVTSVNGSTGAVVLDADDVGALPDDTVIPAAATSNPADLGTAAVGSSSKYAKEDHVHNKPTYSKSDVGLGNVDNVKQYSANNPPPYPVTSVNGQTGAVSLSIPSSASDVGAVAVAQGVAHAGEFVVVGSDGNITTVTMTAWAGGSY